MWKTLRKKIWDWRGLWTTAPTVAGLLLILRMMGWLQPLEWMALDQYFRLRPIEPRDDRIVIIGINETDLQTLGRWPIDDATLAKLLSIVKQQNPRAIGLDLFRDFPVEPGTPQLEQIFKTTPNLIGIEKPSGRKDTSTVHAASLLKQQGQTAVNNVVIDGDGKLRRAMLYWTTPDGSTAIESLGLRLALIDLAARKIEPKAAEDGSGAMQLGKAIFPIFESNDGSYVGADAGGYQMILNFRGKSNSFQTISLTDVLQGRLAPNRLRDRIVLIGPTAESLKDLFYTPYSGNSITTPEKTAGVEIQANVASQILSSALDGRSGIRVWSDRPIPLFPKGFWLQWNLSDYREAAWIFLWSLLGALLAWNLRNPRNALIAIVTAEGSLLLGTYGAFLAGWWIPVVPPALALALSATVLTGYIASLERHDRKLMMNLFGRYVSSSIAETIWRDRDQLLTKGRIKGQKMTVTVLFTDIKNFSTISEATDPELLMEWLSEYMDVMTQIVFEHGAVVDKFIGDAIMALFGVPIAQTSLEKIAQGAENAVRCAIAMGEALQKLNQKWASEGRPVIQMRVGIATGTAVTGSLGGKQRMDYTAIGDTVNIASRLESFDKTIEGGVCRILISDTTQALLKDQFPAKSIGSVQLKGRAQPTEVYQILSLMPESDIAIPPIDAPGRPSVSGTSLLGNASE